MSRSKLFMKKLFRRSNSDSKLQQGHADNNVQLAITTHNMGVKKKRGILKVKSFNLESDGKDSESIVPKKRHSSFEPRRNYIDSLSSLGLMFYAVQYQKPDMLDKLIDGNRDIDINQMNEDGIAVVHFAAMVGSIDSFIVLQKYNADLNVEDIRGNTPLDYTALMRTFETGRFLIANGYKANKHETLRTIDLGEEFLSPWQRLHERSLDAR